MSKKIAKKNDVPPPNIVLSPESHEKFESELCWCIQQLQVSLKSGKLNEKQVKYHTQSLNTLMNNTTLNVKKRQVMRNVFGDYRAKMVDEEKKLSKTVSKVSITKAEPPKSSKFIKKAANCDKDTPVESDKEKFAFRRTDNEFRFNFQ